MLAEKLVPVILLLSLLIFFLKSSYLRYGDTRFLLAAFAMLTAFVFLTAVSVSSLMSSLVLAPYITVLTHGFGALAAWFFAWDAYRASQRNA